LHVIALGQPALLRRHASDHRPRALLMRTLVDETRDAVELLPAHDRAHVVRLVERIADLEFAQLRRKLLEERVEHALVQEETRSCGAGLALPRETHRRDDAVRRLFSVGVREEDLRALAAEL